ncbi:7730_t:CDS:2 [Diversispora eburnea]|uniref:7730_t:CDS:1 n=1 Tax=Diversispora eburnea TaxID=1213867 RepID=A0A9N8Z7U7_9GLOM|nr:7730_t:CDS:2 [Diversispora eburnea]
MAQLEDIAQAVRLEHYRSRQEAAKGFEDDLEFCPSLSAEELAEIRRQVSQMVGHGQSKPNITSPQHKRPIPIIDPNNKTPLNITPLKSSASTAAQVSTFFSRPGSPFSYGGNYSPTYQSLSTPVKVTKSIPIIDPNSGNIVNMPNGTSNNTNNGNNTGFGGFYSDISVR